MTEVTVSLFFPSMLLVSLPASVHLAAATTFSIHLQSQKSLSVNHWARYEDKLPKLYEFTVCHWDRMSYFSTGFNTIWSYCNTKTVNSSLWCIQMEYALLFSTANRDAILRAWLGKYEFGGKIQPFQHRIWSHICWSYSGYTGINSLYFNGKLLARSKLRLRSENLIVDDHNDVLDAELYHR